MFFNRDKYIITLTGDEYDLIIKCLIDLRNNLISQGRYTDVADDILLKMVK